jgi:ribonuclease HI
LIDMGTGLWLKGTGEPVKVEEFRAAITAAGAELLAPTNEWEVLRYRLEGKVGIFYRNAKGRVSLSGSAGQHYANWKAGREITISANEAKRARRTALMDASPQLYTDASAYDKTKSGAWAAILVMPDGAEHEAHGPLRGEVGSSTAAEAMAIANALHTFIKAGHIAPGSALRIVCDNIAVVGYLAHSRTPKAKTPREAVTVIRQLQTKKRLRLAAEWIKGHQPGRRRSAHPLQPPMRQARQEALLRPSSRAERS